MLKKHNTRENRIGFLSFLLIWIIFYIELLQGGIATHDELQVIAQYIEGTTHLSLGARWGMGLFHFPITLLQSSMPNYTLYRLWTIIGLMVACFSAMIIIYRHVDRKLCWVFPIVFVLLAQVEFEHDGLLAFGWGYQFDITFVFISMELFITYKETGKKKYNVLSAVSYLIAVMAYEAFAAFGIMFFLLDLIYMNSQKKITVRELVKDLWLHFLFVLLYTSSFVVLSKFCETGDATIGSETSLTGFLKTLCSYSIGLFPLRFRVYKFKQLFLDSLEISWKNIAIWIIIVYFTKIIVGYLKNSSKEITLKKYIVYSVICLTGIILPNVVISMTSKFQLWTLSGTKTFGTSYYSYFFLIFWFIATMWYAYQKIKFKKTYVAVMFCGIVFTTRFTLISNDYYLEELNKNQHRYEAFVELINSDYLMGLPENAQIYTRDYAGIHLNINSLSSLAASVSGRQISVLNDMTQIDWNMPVYCLKYDSTINGTYLFRAVDEATADEVYVQAKDNLENYYITLHTHSDGALPVYVDEDLIGAYGINVITPNLFTESNHVIIQNGQMDIESFAVNLGLGKLNTSIFSFEGIYGLEDWGRWSQREFSVVIDNINNENYCELAIVLGPGVGESTIYNMSCNDMREQYVVPSDGVELQLSVPLTTGINRISFKSESEDLDVPTDTRNLNTRIHKLDISYGGNIYECSQ